MASAHPLLERLETTIGRYRDTIARLTPELAYLREEREIVMQYLSDFGTALKTLIGDRQASDARAVAAEAEVATLKTQIAADEATLKGMLDATNDEIGDEMPAPATVTVTTSATGATVTVDPTVGTTTHVDPATSTTTTVPHDGSAPTAVDTSITPAQPVEPGPAAVAEAVSAAAAVGVTVPAADQVIPTTLG